MNQPSLILTLPIGHVTATSLGIEGLARHRSPGSGKHFRGRSILVDLATDGEKPGFSFFDEGGWRDAYGDTVKALAGVRAGSRTKTALSNTAFNCVPMSAFRNCHLVKTGGQVLTLGAVEPLASFSTHECDESMTSDDVGRAIGRPSAGARTARLYMILSPVQFVMLSNLTPEEYAWYATHRAGKRFRQVIFTEIRSEQSHLAAESRFENARRELTEKPAKKTKTIVVEDCINQIPYPDWVGYRHAGGGLYVGDRDHLVRYPFPAAIPHAWDKADG